MRDKIVSAMVYLTEPDWDRLMKRTGMKTKNGSAMAVINAYLDTESNVKSKAKEE